MKSSTVYRIREVVKTLSTDAEATQKAVAEIEDTIQKDAEYNGYSNYETWLMSLNLDNEQPLNEMVMTISNAKDLDTYDKAQVLKERVEEMFYNDGLGVYRICDTWTERDFQEVDWCEVIESHLDESYESEDLDEDLDGAE
ncbi:MAG: hypothetical protein D4S01_09080 [Dehalococcoidia bacterium]|nr:MAG: hypothetical protein D4S01_09080 [Dehalococcoidia bacterium]